LQVAQRGVTTKYFSTMRIPLVAGRLFDDADLSQTANRVVIIGDIFVQGFRPTETAIGKHAWFAPNSTKNLTIVGVLAR
jgi:hypothetical protein